MDINIHQWNTLPQHNVANPKNSWLQSRSIKQTQRESDKSSDASMFASLDRNFSVAAQWVGTKWQTQGAVAFANWINPSEFINYISDWLKAKTLLLCLWPVWWCTKPETSTGGWFVKFGFATTERDNENDIVSYLRVSANIAIDVYQVAPRSVSSPCDAGVERPKTLAERWVPRFHFSPNSERHLSNIMFHLSHPILI